MYLHFFIKSLIVLHVFPQKWQVAIQLPFKFIGGYAAKCTFVIIGLHFVYKTIEFAACFP